MTHMHGPLLDSDDNGGEWLAIIIVFIKLIWQAAVTRWRYSSQPAIAISERAAYVTMNI
jgi:hypothetical protein